MEELVLKTYVASLCKTNENEHALFTPDINYSIPGYQRPYEWSNEKIENMMSSLLDFYQEGIKSYNKDALLFGTKKRQQEERERREREAREAKERKEAHIREVTSIGI